MPGPSTTTSGRRVDGAREAIHAEDPRAVELKSRPGLKRSEDRANLDISRSTVAECLRHTATAGIGWPLPADFADVQLEEKELAKLRARLTRGDCTC